MNKLSLYVYPEFCSDYGNGLAFAIAESQTEAIKMIAKASGASDDDRWLECYWGPCKVYSLDNPPKIAFGEMGGG